MKKLTVVFSSRSVNLPNKTAAHLSQAGIQSAWHCTVQKKMSLPLSQG
jgi:hypothetical protein